MKLTRRPLLLAAVALPCLAACTTPPLPAHAPETGARQWSGRLTLRIDSDPPQSFAALFELRGAPGHGELKLSTPIGNTLGVVQWSPHSATLDDGSRIQHYASIDQLLSRMTGAALPVNALFDWLSGQPTQVSGWQPQLSQVRDGRLQATRTLPAPTAELRVIFEPVVGAGAAP